MKRFSIKARVTVWFALAMFVVASCVFYVMILHRSAQIKSNAERNLRSSVENFAEFTLLSGGVFPEKEDFPEMERPMPEQNGTMPPMPIGERPFRGENSPRTYAGGVHLAVYNDTFQVQTGLIPFELENLDFVDSKIRTASSNGERYLILDKMVKTGNDQIFWVKGVSNISGAMNAVNATILADYFLICILITIAAAGGYFIVGRALSPITKMRKTAQTIADSNDLSQRIALGDGKDEVYQLASVFDEMLGKIQHAFASEKQFTSDASHELRTPVAVILSECEYTEDCAKTEGEYKESLAVIKRQGDKMAKLISELLSISRMDKETFVPAYERINLSELVEIVCDEQTEIHDSSIVLHKHVQENVYGKADSSLIARLIVNLISNAYQYGKDGGRIDVTLKKEKESIVFTVADDGIGIATEDIPNIWERFYRADKARCCQNGSMGLGLSMVKQIAALHGGRVSVESMEGKGSTFTFTMAKCEK